MEQTGLFWHAYPEILIGWCDSYDERAEHIRILKTSREQKLRLRLLQPVKGELPQEVVDAVKARYEAVKVYDKAWRAYNEAGKAYDEAWTTRAYNESGKARDEALEAFVETGKARDEAGKACDETRRAYNEALFNHKDEIEALHTDECLNCPWDGETIFSAA